MLTLVVPCFNEAGNAPEVERGLLPVARTLAHSTPVEVIFVDDGSADGTQAAFSDVAARHDGRGITVRLVAHDRNRGLGAALRTGFAEAQGDVVVTTDADGTYRFSEIPALLAALAPDVDIVTASPYHPEGAVAGVPRHRLVLSKGSSWVYRRLVGTEIHTYTALFRAYRRRVLEAVPFTSDGFLAGTELLVNALAAGFRVAEYPTVLHARAVGVSSARLWRTTRAHLDYQRRVLLARLGVGPAPWTNVGPGNGVAPPLPAHARPLTDPELAKGNASS